MVSRKEFGRQRFFLDSDLKLSQKKITRQIEAKIISSAFFLWLGLNSLAPHSELHFRKEFRFCRLRARRRGGCMNCFWKNFFGQNWSNLVKFWPNFTVSAGGE